MNTNYLKELSDEQKSIVCHSKPEKSILVTAAAGSGKTRVLTYRIKYLFDNLLNTSSSVLVLTFTNKAADEIRERVISYKIDRSRIHSGTFHSFCLEQIIIPNRKYWGYSTAPDVFDESDCLKIISSLAASGHFGRHQFNTDDRNQFRKAVYALKSRISEHKKLTILKSNVQDNSEDFLIGFESYKDDLFGQNAIDYDDVLIKSLEFLKDNSAHLSLIQRKFPYIIVDEAQDMNEIQYSLIKHLIGDRVSNAMLVGDPSQSIYAFNGSDPKYFEVDYLKDFPVSHYTISHNYRSSKAILLVSNSIYDRVNVDKAYFNGKLEAYQAKNEDDEADWIITNASNLLDAGSIIDNEVTHKLGNQSIGILARNTYAINTLIQKLEQSNLKNSFSVRRRGGQFSPETEELQLLFAHWKLNINPSNSLAREQQIKTRFNLIDHAKAPDSDKKLANLLFKFAEACIDRPKTMLSELSELELSILPIIIDENERLLLLSELRELQFLIRSYFRSTSTSGFSVKGFLSFLSISTVENIDCPIVLSTIHASKGLEYDCVFLVGLAEGTLPSYLAKSKEDIQQEKNLAYVAATRAKLNLYISYPKEREMPWGDTRRQLPSRFFKDQFK